MIQLLLRNEQKSPKQLATTLANLENHPEITKIDAILADLHSRHQAALKVKSIIG